MTKKSVAIVGAGVSGMATAISLANKGFAVTVFEKNAQSGGRCSQRARWWSAGSAAHRWS